MDIRAPDGNTIIILSHDIKTKAVQITLLFYISLGMRKIMLQKPHSSRLFLFLISSISDHIYIYIYFFFTSLGIS